MSNAKGFLDLNVNQAVIDKLSKCQEIAPNFTYSQKFLISKYHWKKKMDQLLQPYKTYDRDI